MGQAWDKIDVIKEISSIGSGHAATALSKLLNKRIYVEIDNPVTININIDKDYKVDNLLPMVGISFYLLGEATGKILFTVPERDSFAIVDLLLRNKPNTTKELSPITLSTVKEFANMVIGSYITALGDFLNILIVPSLPSYYQGTEEEIFVKTINEKEIADEIFYQETRLWDINKNFISHMFLIPYKEGLQVILKRIEEML